MAEPEGTRDRLLTAAIALLDKGGEVALRVDAVAEHAGVTRPSVYHFFRSREGLVVATQAERYRRSLLFGMSTQTAVVEACQTRQEFEGFVRLWIRSIGSEEGVERRRIRTEVLGSSVRRPELRALVEACDAEAARGIARVIEIAQERGWAGESFDPQVAGLWWFGMMNGRYLVEGGLADDAREEWDRLAATAIIRLFGTPSG